MTRVPLERLARTLQPSNHAGATVTSIALAMVSLSMNAPAAGATPEDGAWASKSTAVTVESYAPQAFSGVALNAKVQVIFAPSSTSPDHIDPRTVMVQVDGVPVDANGYYVEWRGNREFRFVPFPFWEPGHLYTVEVLPGVQYQNSSERMDEPFVWDFGTQYQPVDETYNPYGTAPLTAGELEAAHAGAPDRFLEADLVQDYLDAGSTLYQISVSVDPTDPEVVALGEKMLSSLIPLGAVGLSAVQIGINRRLFVADVDGERLVFINPVVTSWSETLYVGPKEGCLSIPYVKAEVARPKWIHVAFDTPGGGRVEDAYYEDYDAKVWLHEYDHINGILMTDRQEDKLFVSPQPERATIGWVPVDPRDRADR